MPRDHADIRTDMWGDSDWRNLTPGAQWLYLNLLSSPTLNYVGVADWRPRRISKTARALTAEQVEKYAAELVNARMIVVDDDTEEVMIRSFLRHDGLMVNPNMWKSVGRDYAAVASPVLRSAISFEMLRLRDEQPDGMPTMKGGTVDPWSSKDLQTALRNAPSNTPYQTPSGTPSSGGSDTGSDSGCPPTPTPSPLKEKPAPAVLVTENDFQQAWEYWPKKTERKKSLEKFKTVARRRGVDVVTADIRRFGQAYAQTTERKFVPALNVWLNGERWTDELPTSQGYTAPVAVVEDRWSWLPAGVSPDEFHHLAGEFGEREAKRMILERAA